MRKSLIALASVLIVWVAQPTSARADDYGANEGDDSKTESQIEAEDFMAKGDWKSAAPLLEAHVAGFPADDEAMAELGHVYDKLGDQDTALYMLQKALWINSRSLEANLYLGEYYIGLKDRVHAVERLTALDQICIFGCGEYRTLKREIAAMGAQAP